MANAFHAIAPQSAACTSSSKKLSYDVFINHRGKDVKLKLASTIYNMLDLMGVQVFLDEEELELGDSFPEAIEAAMGSASVHIAIFSPSYAESPWCLEELLFMLQIDVTIIPVFYGVDPSDLRYVTKGKYADAFRGHERKRRYNPEKLKEWEEALSRVSYRNGGKMFDDKCDEGKLLREIVETVLQRMKKVPLEVATFPVGLDAAVQDFESEVGSFYGSENMNIVGILGMGGSGKTTLAKELYNRKRSSMSRSSFLFNVRDAFSTNSLHKLQEKLLEDLNIQHSAFDNIHQGREILARGLISMTVLIVLDDVNDVEQMHALLPSKKQLGRDSFIIVTTRDVNVLTFWGISLIYHMKLLDPFNAKQLFCRHAFSHPYSQLGFEYAVENNDNFQDLIERFVEACNGLPLSLKVFGAMVNGKSKECWESQLLKISRILPNKIAERLKLSYDALDPEVRQMFLDIACFFIGEEKSLVATIWDGSGWSGELGWETLANKCLVGLDEDDCIEMHDHLRDLGREIARDVSPSRIWNEEQSILGGRTLIRGIVTAKARPWVSCYRDTYPLSLENCMENFSKRPSWPGPQLLAVRGNDFREEFAALSRDLVWLRWCDFKGSYLPSWLSLANLRGLELHNARNLEELWQNNVQLPLQLRELIIYIIRGTHFRGLPRSIGRLTHLKKIVLYGDDSGMICNYNWMRRLPEEFCQLCSLEFLELSFFPMLSSLPDDFGKLSNLRTLNLRALQLTVLPESFKQLTALQSLDISDCKSLMFTSEMLHVLEFMTELKVLRIFDCPQLEELPHLTTQVSLRELDLRPTGLRELPNNIGQVTNLETLVIGSHNLTSLPTSLGELSCLTSLEIVECKLLESLPEALGRLSNLRSLRIFDTPLLELGLGIELPSACNLKSLKSLYLVNTLVYRISISDNCCPSLETLILSDNNNLREVEALPGNVRDIMVNRCPKMRNMRVTGGLLNLERVQIYDCPDLEVLHSVGCTITIRDSPKSDCCSPVLEGMASPVTFIEDYFYPATEEVASPGMVIEDYF